MLSKVEKQTKIFLLNVRFGPNLALKAYAICMYALSQLTMHPYHKRPVLRYFSECFVTCRVITHTYVELTIVG